MRWGEDGGAKAAAVGERRAPLPPGAGLPPLGRGALRRSLSDPSRTARVRIRGGHGWQRERKAFRASGACERLRRGARHGGRVGGGGRGSGSQRAANAPSPLRSSAAAGRGRGASYSPGRGARLAAARPLSAASSPRGAGWAAAIAGGSFVCRATGMSAPSCSRSRASGPGEAASRLRSSRSPAGRQAGGRRSAPSLARLDRVSASARGARLRFCGGPWRSRGSLYGRPPACNRASSPGAPHRAGLPAAPTQPPAAAPEVRGLGRAAARMATVAAAVAAAQGWGIWLLLPG
ncbi:fibroin heavy chain-like [Podarcis raffonei]|uniref:fibroin heavy chain-like n=1 Tax=Podarcis raffonei TaxID=65483 RepID=UPI0023296A8C|nr:fibroin heavy chain-like [Podarcis raffonei]